MTDAFRRDSMSLPQFSAPHFGTSGFRRRAARHPRTCLTAVALATLLLTACGGDDDAPPAPPVTTPPTGAASSAAQFNGLTGDTKDLTIELKEGTNMAATPSPDGTRIAFTAQGALWTIPVAGGTATRITPWTMEPTAPVWSPNGASIVFQNYTADGNWHLWSIAPDGSGAKELTTGFFDDREPAWTPDGTALVFASDRGGDGQYKIWRYTLATGAYTKLTAGNGAESNPAVSADGTRIAFVDTGNVYTAPIAGGTPTLVGAGGAPAFAGAAGALVWQSTTNSLRVGTADIVSGEDLFPFPVQALTNNRFLYTADGKLRIRNRDGTSPVDVPFSASLSVRRPGFTKRKDHGFDNFASRAVKGISAPALSPDGQSIAFVALNDVWVMKIGETPVRLTNDTDRDGSVQWTSDGTAVYFSSERGNAGQLAVDRIDIATKARTRLASFAGKSMVTPKLSPTGDRIAYTTLSGQLEVWNIGSGTSSVVIQQVGSQVSTPQWLPGGAKILLVDNDRINNRFREGYNKLRLIDIAARTGTFYPVGDAPRQVSDREEGAMVLSPDGRTAAMVIDSVLWTMALNADGTPAGTPRQVTTEVADLPSWAGDSKTLLYKSADKLRLVQSDGSNAKDVAVNLNWTPATGPTTTIVWAGSLYTGTSATLQTNVDIVISNNRITAIRPHQADAATTATRFVDASTLTVMPGLWDPHIHPLTLYQGGQYGQYAALLLSYGITSTQSVAGPLHQSIEIREALEAGNLLGPRLFVSPPLWEGNRAYYSFARSLRTPQVADLEIAKARTMDADFLKSYVRAPIPIMQKIAQGGIDFGIPTGTHMLSPGAATGIAGTTHLSATQRMGYGWSKSINNLTYQDAYDLHAKGEFHNIDTLFSSLALTSQDSTITSDDRFRALVPPNFIVGLQTTPVPSATVLAGIKRDADQSAKVQNAGGLLALGTDSPLVAPGIATHTALRAAVLSYSNHQALQNVTINAAKMAFVDKDLGSVEVGKLADLAIVSGNPLTDIKAAANVQYVVKNGTTYSLAQILAPFKTPVAMAARRRSIEAYQLACGRQPQQCETGAHAD